MKNVLISIIAVLLTAVIILCMVKGISIGKFKVLSIPDIKISSTEMDADIEELNNLKNLTYKKKLDSLQSAIKELTTAKQKYLDLASVSTDSEIQQANQEQSYAMEFLWNKVGSYATKEGLGLTWNLVSTGVGNKYTLNFTVSGSYISIINYMYELENDSELSFRIENFKMVSGATVASTSQNNSAQDNYKVTATFKVSNIGIKEETISTSISNNSSTNQQNNTDNNTEKTNQ